MAQRNPLRSAGIGERHDGERRGTRALFSLQITRRAAGISVARAVDDMASQKAIFDRPAFHRRHGHKIARTGRKILVAEALLRGIEQREMLRSFFIIATIAQQHRQRAEPCSGGVHPELIDRHTARAHHLHRAAPDGHADHGGGRHFAESGRRGADRAAVPIPLVPASPQHPQIDRIARHKHLGCV